MLFVVIFYVYYVLYRLFYACMIDFCLFLIYRQSHYPEWFIHGLESCNEWIVVSYIVMGSKSSSMKTVANGYIFHREVKKYNVVFVNDAYL